MRQHKGMGGGGLYSSLQSPLQTAPSPPRGACCSAPTHQHQPPSSAPRHGPSTRATVLGLCQEPRTRGPGTAPARPEPGRSSWPGCSLVSPLHAGMGRAPLPWTSHRSFPWGCLGCTPCLKHGAQSSQDKLQRVPCAPGLGPAQGWVPEVSTLHPSYARQEGQRHQQAL